MTPLAPAPLTADSAGGDSTTTGQGGGLAGLLWLTWRQHRWALAGSVLLAAALTGWIAYLAADMTALHHQCHDLPCASGSTQEAALTAPFGPLRVANDLLQVVEFLPLLVGMFLGVPLLAREHEQRTLLLAWSQDVSPARWLWTKLALIGTVVAVLTAALAAVCDHLAHVMADVSEGGLFDGSMFLDSGMLPLALGVAWFAVGVALGAGIRRVLPAVVGAVAGYAALLAVVEWRYPTFETPVSRFRPIAPLGDAGPIGSVNDLKIKGGFRIGPGEVQNLYDSSGHAVDYTRLKGLCSTDLGPDTLLPCLSRHHMQTFVKFQPADRIPQFHLILACGYLGIGALALAAVWLIVRGTSLSAG
ncbi:hypothetical protein V2S66_24425 [Streptomyces sp. V4-01]|uniref:ABC transporter permease n=1 Tax=Actinacidiphila polyblastidii TaxID=3110430 RepID=A0ABU7PGZ3_9ACTN|nr:hypothetical protein [Streptomyces sp. V4-01]